MTEIAKLLSRLNELDAGDLPSTEDAPLDKLNLKNGYRLVSRSGTPWFSCEEDARKRYKDGILKTDRGIVRVTSISPVDDDSQNCSFCGAQLQPPEAGSQDQTNRQNLQSLGMGDMSGGGQPPDQLPGGGMF